MKLPNCPEYTLRCNQCNTYNSLVNAFSIDVDRHADDNNDLFLSDLSIRFLCVLHINRDEVFVPNQTIVDFVWQENKQTNNLLQLVFKTRVVIRESDFKIINIRKGGYGIHPVR